ncbi:sulfurtransferase [Deefgea tanakiae]|uniref:Sulfurtransferase n=1 Tax=Deefgea tanakiae TaxID=2865840 RepID=A0ABX8Z5Q0_9NEIS|nr:sulfurtransferase [Deefgea tanakiae]QZA77901.1 sulfurtransferase [Deefgea tanakiae]
MHPVINVAQLQALMADPALVIVDCRHDLANPAAGRAAYTESHIPNARFLHLDEDLSGEKLGHNGRHPLPDPAQLAARVGQLGISESSKIVAYDASGGPFAARLWWLLRWLGCDSVQVLNGGWPAWLAAQAPVETTTPMWPASTFNTQLRPELHVRTDDVLANLASAQFEIVDARSAERFIGIGETLDPVAGHIPGAINRFFMLNLADGHFKSVMQLRQEWLQLLGDRTPAQWVHQCGSGVTACHNLLALEVAGLSGGRLYPGSWSEWCSDPARPMLC